VTYGERLTSSVTQSAPAATKSAPKMLTFESVFVLRWKIWDMTPQRSALPPETGERTRASRRWRAQAY
jgi:hypothetical protein